MTHSSNASSPEARSAAASAAATSPAKASAPVSTAPAPSPREKERLEVLGKAAKAKAASRAIGQLTTQRKNEVLLAVAEALLAPQSVEDILAANDADVARGRQAGMSESLVDRLRLDHERLEGMSDGLKQVASLPDPVGEVIRGRTLPNGIRLSQIRVPLGVMGMVYEARPNVTVDAFGLALKSGNVALLRGSKSAVRSNTALVDVLRQVLRDLELPEDAVQLLPCESHDSVQDLITARDYVDLVIPRGGAGLINAVVTNATVPTIETGTGNCHLYIDSSADVQQAEELLLNGKTRRTSVCNATETVLLDSKLDDGSITRLLTALHDAGVRIHGDPAQLQSRGFTGEVIEANDEDWTDEYLSMDIAAKLVDGVSEAVAHINQFGSGHTDAVAATDWKVCEQFVAEVDSAAVNVNASTAFTDGEQYGFGAEIGISTQKLHARGPMGLPELTSTKWVLRGDGQTRP